MISKLIKTSVIFFMIASPALSKTIRYTDMGERELEDFLKSETGDIAEFRTGDILRLKLQVNGDILETTASPSTEILIKKAFFLKAEGDNLLLSWDNEEYLPFKDQIQGRLKATASGDDVASDILIELDANQQN